jgi:hypothetical protein
MQSALAGIALFDYAQGKFRQVRKRFDAHVENLAVQNGSEDYKNV